MHSTCEGVCACVWYCMFIKVVRFYTWNEPPMTIIVVDDDLMTRDGWSIVEDVDDAIACSQQHCKERMVTHLCSRGWWKDCEILGKRPTDQVTLKMLMEAM